MDWIRRAVIVSCLLGGLVWFLASPAKANWEDHRAQGWVRYVSSYDCGWGGCAYDIVFEGDDGVVFNIPVYVNGRAPGVWSGAHVIVRYGDRCCRTHAYHQFEVIRRLP